MALSEKELAKKEAAREEFNKSLTGLSMNIRSINYVLSRLFQRYSTALNKITGGDILSNEQVKQIQYRNGLYREYEKGKIVFKHNIDKLQFLLDNRTRIADTLGLTPNQIWTGRRDFGRMTEYIAKLDGKYDLGEKSYNMQMYVSKHDNNVGSLDSEQDWVDYILTKTWVDNLGKAAVDEWEGDYQDNPLTDQRIKYLSNVLQGMLKDHELDYHKNLAEFDPDDYIDSGKNNRYIDVMNKLHSFGKLDYVFYELFKPIGGSTEKYIKVKLYTSGELDITGVLSLSDCEHIPWEYGSKEYLRSLNTGNQRYDFKISLPFNDLNSVLWWKPDEREELEVDDEQEGEITEKTGWRDYKPYETERFLRWFGTNYVPILDLDNISKKTLCSAPQLSNDVQSDAFYTDATHIVTMNADLTKLNIDNSTSQSLLSLATKSTIDVINKPDGQYLSMVVSGHQQTSCVAFHITGKMYNAIQEMNHYANTWRLITQTYKWLCLEILFLERTMSITPSIETVWEKMFPDLEYIPEGWRTVKEYLKPFQSPTMVDLLRFRQLDIETINDKIEDEMNFRMDFLLGISGMNTCLTIHNYIQSVTKDEILTNEIEQIIGNTIYYNSDLYKYIYQYTSNNKDKPKWRANIPFGEDQMRDLLIYPLDEIYERNYTATELEERKKYNVSFDMVTVDELRTTIETLNTLIVRLPTNTYQNKVASRHIFLDWKEYVDRSIEHLVADGQLSQLPKQGKGTDGKMHDYIEYYTDQLKTPLVDYSYLYDEDGNLLLDTDGKPFHDRWDYWSERDFPRPR